MKITKLFFGFEIHWSFRLRRAKTVNVSIPDKADDTHYSSTDKCIYYWGDCKKHKIKLPDHIQGEELFCSDMYIRDWNDDGTMKYATDRYIEIKLYY